MDIRSQILSLLGSIKRPGMDALLDFINTSNYFEANCNGHHFIGKGGMAQHSMEVYAYMKEHNTLALPLDSIILCAFTHDIGKTFEARRSFAGRHDQRSLKLLESCGVQLSEAERTAILNHEPCWTGKKEKYPLYALLVEGDRFSTGTWKGEHADAVAARKAAHEAGRRSHKRH